MSIREFIITLLSASFFCVAFQYGNAQSMNYSSLPDSTRQEIRLCTHLLIPADKVSQYKRLISTGSPVAFDGRHTSPSVLKKLEVFSSSQAPVLIVTTPDQPLPDHFPSIRIATNDFDQYTTTGGAKEPDLTTLNSFSNRELLLITIKDTLSPIKELVKLWQRRGKKPNFIRADQMAPGRQQQLAKELNQQRKIFGVVTTDEQLLQNVLLKDMPGCILNGYFSLPLFDQLLLKPYKAGYHFSPDVINNSPENEKNMKRFKATRLAPDFELSDYFIFDNGVKNICRPQNTDFVTQNIHFENDPVFGSVASFRSAYIDAGVESRQILKSTFSITVWIKPTELRHNNSILGKGTNFVLKLHDGKLTFTMAGIKDYISTNSVIQVNQWTHIAVVYSAVGRNLSFYLNGKKTDQISLVADYTGSEEHSLIIGSNLWEEFFIGNIYTLKIWERELNDEEIMTDYEFPHPRRQGSRWTQLSLLALLIIAITAFILFKRKKRKTKLSPGDQKETSPMKTSEEAKAPTQIRCFGSLRIQQQGNELTARFSPKLKQLFILILLHSAPGRRGISSKKMSELLWPGMNASNAKNIRGTNMQNLRQALSECPDITIIFKEKMWLLDITNNVYCDYFRLERLLQSMENRTGTLLPSDLQQLIEIVKPGKFLPAIETSWLDHYKEQFSSRLLEICLSALAQPEQQPVSLQLDLAEIISMYDELNETALQTKIHILNIQGKHGVARSIYQNYEKLYYELYNSKYPVDFLELIKKTDSPDA